MLRRLFQKYFWEKRFKVYAKWKETWWCEYQQKGYVDSLTGFRFSGVMKKNDVSKKEYSWANIEGEKIYPKVKNNPDVQESQGYKKRKGLEYRDGKAASDGQGRLFMDSVKTIKGKTQKGNMSARLEEGLKGFYIFLFPYDKDIVNDVKKIEGRRYDPSSKTWQIPIEQEDDIINLMEQYTIEED
jgi:hypothetical protein